MLRLSQDEWFLMLQRIVVLFKFRVNQSQKVSHAGNSFFDCLTLKLKVTAILWNVVKCTPNNTESRGRRLVFCCWMVLVSFPTTFLESVVPRIQLISGSYSHFLCVAWNLRIFGLASSLQAIICSHFITWLAVVSWHVMHTVVWTPSAYCVH